MRTKQQADWVMKYPGGIPSAKPRYRYWNRVAPEPTGGSIGAHHRSQCHDIRPRHADLCFRRSVLGWVHRHVGFLYFQSLVHAIY